MSKRSSKNDYPILNAIIVLILVFVLAPALPLIFLFLAIMYFLNIRGAYGLIAGAVAIIVVCVAFGEYIVDFFKEFQNSLLRLSDCIIYHSFKYDFGFTSYSFTSWIIIALIAIMIAGYFKIVMEINDEKKKAGIKPLNKTVKEVINQNTLSDKPSKFNYLQGTIIGVNKSNKLICCPDNSKHIFVSGTTGSGKTVLLSNFIETACMMNYGALIVDGKGDEGKGSLLEITKKFCKEYNRKLYIVSMNNPSISNKYNPFAGADETVAKDMLINMTQWSEEHYKSNTERYIQRLITIIAK